VAGFLPITVLYDGDCRFCTRSARQIEKRFGRPNVSLRNFQEPGALDPYPGVTHDACMEKLHMVTSAGRVFAGAEAFARLVATVPVLGLLAWLYYVPGLRQVADFTYSVVARHRYRLLAKSEACDTGTCHLHGQ
jgi:predicted DCC family thiol-disulfide oxidoreductase YuxK